MRISDWSSDVCSSDLANASYEVRESGSDDQAETVKSAGVTWSHDLTRSMSLSTSLDYDNIDFSGLDQGREDNLYSFRASLSEQIATDVDATATYIFRHLDSNENSQDATENAIRSAERRVGKKDVSTCRSLWSPYN